MLEYIGIHTNFLGVISKLIIYKHYFFFSGYGAGYNMKEKGSSNINYMPEGMEKIDFFNRNDFSFNH